VLAAPVTAITMHSVRLLRQADADGVPDPPATALATVTPDGDPG
jgi:hypothetical protein